MTCVLKTFRYRCARIRCVDTTNSRSHGACPILGDRVPAGRTIRGPSPSAVSSRLFGALLELGIAGSHRAPAGAPHRRSSQELCRGQLAPHDRPQLRRGGHVDHRYRDRRAVAARTQSGADCQASSDRHRWQQQRGAAPGSGLGDGWYRFNLSRGRRLGGRTPTAPCSNRCGWDCRAGHAATARSSRRGRGRARRLREGRRAACPA